MSNNIKTEWFLVSRHGAVLFLIATGTAVTARELSDTLCVTLRSTRTILADLRQADMISANRRGRMLHYRVNPDAHFRHPVLREISLGDVFGRWLARERRVAAAG
jgi:hypothetical protein